MAQIRGPLPGIYISSGRYYKQVREGSKKRWIPLSRVDDGLAALHRAIADLHDRPPPPADGMPALVEAWELEQLPRYAGKTQADARRLNASIVAVFGALRAGQVGTPHVVQYLQAFAGRPRTYNAHRAQLRELMRFAELKGWRPAGSNPTLAIRTMRTAARTRYLSDSEMRRIKVGALFAAPPPGWSGRRRDLPRTKSGPMLCALLDLLYLTGQAIGDVLALDVDDLKPRGITFRRAKVEHSTGAAVTIGWTPALRATTARLLELRKQAHAVTRATSPALVVTPRDGQRAAYDGIKSAWYRACERAGVEDAHIHDIKGKALTDVDRVRGMREARLMGQHATEGQTADYVRARESVVVRATR